MTAISFKGRHFQKDMIVQSIRWYLAYALSYRDIEEMMQERGFSVDHSTINRWVLHYSPQLEAAFRRKKKRVGNRWRMDETYIKVKGQWKYYYRAVDKQGQTIDFLLTATRDSKAALRFLKKAIGQNGKPSLINIDKSGGNKAGLKQVNRDQNTRIKIRQCKYLNNIIEQDHRRIKRLTRPMLGFKNLYAAQRTLAGMEIMAMIKKGQMKTSAGDEQSPAEQFYALAA
ncbi:MAG: IS6 family transposase [Nitrospirales bacterium]|jgi:transposase-like protein|nr:IS6 family transposase [Nitrospirota bacterium]